MTNNKPTHHLSVVTGEGEKAVFTRIAPLWVTKSGSAYSGVIPDGVTISGRVYIAAVKTDERA